MSAGILTLIERMGEANKEKKDIFTLEYLISVRDAIKNKDRKLWPDKVLRTEYNKLDKTQQGYFIDIVGDMIEGLQEHFEKEDIL